MINVPTFLPKGILFDIDGTIVNSKRKILPKITATIKAAGKRKIVCSVATARHYASIKNYILPYFPPNSFHITSCGGQIVSPKGKVIWQTLIDEGVAKSIIRNVETLGGAIIFGSGAKLFCSSSIYKNLKGHPWKIDVQIYNKSQSGQFTLISVVETNPDVKKYIDSLKNLKIYRLYNSSGKEYFDITSEKTNKLIAARLWCKKLKINLNEVMFVGNGENDYELMNSEIYGIAVDNSSNNLKRVAKKIVEHKSLEVFLTSLLTRNNSHR